MILYETYETKNPNLKLSGGKKRQPMRIKTVELVGFKRFDHLTIDLGNTPKKIVAMVGPNGCGKSSIFDAFEQELKKFRSHGKENEEFYSKGLFYDDNPENEQYKQRTVTITPHSGRLDRKSFYIRTSYRFTPKIEIKQIQASS